MRSARPRLGCYGAPQSPSLTLDRLARDGLRFDEAISQSSWTLPSVASIFTGLFPSSHGVIGEEKHQPGDGHGTAPPDPSYLAESISTLAGRAQRAGITTVGVSANHLVSRATNLATGFETFAEFTWQGGDTVVWAAAEQVNRTFLEWLEQNRQYRFLGYLHYMDIHAPYQPPEKYRPVPGPDIREPVRLGDLGKITVMTRGAGETALTARELDYLRALYDAQIRYWDSALGDLLAGLSAAGITDRTVIVVTSDHGEAFLEHGRLNHGIQLYDELIRVPLVISGLHAAEQRTTPLQAQGIDLYPTLAAILGLEIPLDLPGRNLLADRGERPAVSELRGLVALRTPDWKLIHDRAQNRFELYDLTADPVERNNVFAKDSTGTALVRQLGDWGASIPPPPPAAGRDPEFREKLRALGYID